LKAKDQQDSSNLTSRAQVSSELQKDASD